jgi:hypothetical protein
MTTGPVGGIALLVHGAKKPMKQAVAGTSKQIAAQLHHKNITNIVTCIDSIVKNFDLEFHTRITISILITPEIRPEPYYKLTP